MPMFNVRSKSHEMGSIGEAPVYGLGRQKLKRFSLPNTKKLTIKLRNYEFEILNICATQTRKIYILQRKCLYLQKITIMNVTETSIPIGK